MPEPHHRAPAFIDFTPHGDAPAVPPEMPPPGPADEPPRRPWAFIVVAGVVAVALAVASVLQMTGPRGGRASSDASDGTNQTATSSTSVSTAWRGPLFLGGQHSMAFPWVVTGNTMVAYDGFDSVIGVDLNNLRIAWTLPLNLIDGGYATIAMGDETGIAMQLDDQLIVLDPSTGKTIGQAQLTLRPASPSTNPSTDSTTPVTSAPSQTAPTSQPSVTPTRPESVTPTRPESVRPTRQTTPPVWQDVVWAGGGYIVLVNEADQTLSVRGMRDPGRPLWTAPNMWSEQDDYAGTSVYVVAGKWVNTGDGLRDLATGAVAPFSGTTGLTPGGPVYYIGSTPDRVFVVSTLGQVQGGSPPLLTPVDMTNNAPYLAGGIPATTVETDPELPTVVARVGDGTDADYPTAGYLWPSDELLWQQPSFVNWASSGLVGSTYVSSTTDRHLVVIDAMTGKELWRSAPFGPYGMATPLWDHIGSTLYVVDDSLTAYDASAGCVKQWTVALPEPVTPNYRNIFTTPGHVFVIGQSNSLWTMDV